MYPDKLTIGIVAGEVSGDALGADFMAKMNAICPNVRWVGVGGRQMHAQGLHSLIDMDRLSVMGLLEVVKHLPDLMSAKREILSAFNQASIDIFVGIDAPDFNLRVSQSLKKTTRPPFCVQYVSPSVWAWREGRIHTIKKATDLVLCLFPFELDVYARHQHPAVCVGHPLLDKLHADERPKHVIFDEFIKRFNLTTPPSARPICVMAGSRTGEIGAILPLLIDSMVRLSQMGEFLYILPVVSQAHATLVKTMIDQQAPMLSAYCRVVVGDDDTLTTSQHAMNACELILLASGTATLEALLLHRPMVVVYQLKALTYAIAKRLIKIPYVSLPNILAHHQTGKAIVPELIQTDATAQNIAHHATRLLDDPSEQSAQLAQTTARLRQDSHANPAEAVLTHFFFNINLCYNEQHFTLGIFMRNSNTLSREQKKRQTRQAFYNAVLDLCMTGQAFSSISLRQVTREVGVVPTAFYRHFHDMEELGESLVQDELGDALATLREHMQFGKKRTFERQIAKSVQLFFKAVDTQPRYWQFIASERFGGSEAVRQAIKEQIKTFANVMSEDLALQPAFEHISREDRYLLAETGVNLSFSWIIDWIDLTYMTSDEQDPTLESAKKAMLHHCTRQMQMILYGAYNWKSSEETVID